MHNDSDTILKVIVGSQAHELATENSDFDYHGIYVLPTSTILSLSAKVENTHWFEGNIDDVSWEIGHFLKMAVACNPTILEVFRSPVKFATDEGYELRELFPYLWHPQRVRDAFVGYGVNQRKKFLKQKDARSAKYAVAYLRVLVQAEHLLLTGELEVSTKNTSEYETLKKWKAWTQADIDYGEVIQKCKDWEDKVNWAYEHAHLMRQGPDLTKVNDFLLKVRESHWIAK